MIPPMACCSDSGRPAGGPQQTGAPPGGASQTWWFSGAPEVAATVDTHLFGIGANNSGTTFIKEVLATSRRTWNLPREGQFAAGFAGPTTVQHGRLLWSCGPWGSALRDEAAYDWPRIRKAWRAQSFARSPAASVFYTKAPPFLFLVEALRTRFENAKFLFTVRNPYAVCVGIYGYRLDQPPVPGVSYFTAVAEHVVNCMAQQRRNIERYVCAPRPVGVFFTYETMCAEPERVAASIRKLVPALDDLRFRQRLSVKGVYHEPLVDMNPRALGRLTAPQLAAINRVFSRHRRLLGYFGYDLLQRPPRRGEPATADQPVSAAANGSSGA